MIPLFHDFQGKRVVIFGGGDVAARKAALFGTEAEVLVLARRFEDRLRDLDCNRLRVDLDPSLAAHYAERSFLTIPATDDPELNDQIAARARAAGALVNRVDQAGETITPSVVRGEHVTVGIATEGSSPAVSKYLRQRLEPEIEAIDAMVPFQATLRRNCDDLSESARKTFLWDVLEDERIRSALVAGDRERAEELAATHRP